MKTSSDRQIIALFQEILVGETYGYIEICWLQWHALRSIIKDVIA